MRIIVGQTQRRRSQRPARFFGPARSVVATRGIATLAGAFRATGSIARFAAAASERTSHPAPAGAARTSRCCVGAARARTEFALRRTAAIIALFRSAAIVTRFRPARHAERLNFGPQLVDFVPQVVQQPGHVLQLFAGAGATGTFAGPLHGGRTKVATAWPAPRAEPRRAGAPAHAEATGTCAGTTSGAGPRRPIVVASTLNANLDFTPVVPSKIVAPIVLAVRPLPIAARAVPVVGTRTISLAAARTGVGCTARAIAVVHRPLRSVVATVVLCQTVGRLNLRRGAALVFAGLVLGGQTLWQTGERTPHQGNRQ